MVALRTRPKGGVIAPFGLCTLIFSLMPAPIGTQDLGALFSYHAAAAAAPRSTALASPFGTIHLATYSFPRPIGSTVPRVSGYRLASLDPRALDLNAIAHDGVWTEPPVAAPRRFPAVNRALKGDSLLPAARPKAPEPAPPPTVRTEGAQAALAPPAAPEPEAFDLSEVNAGAPPEDSIWPALDAAELSPSDNPTMDTARSYIGYEFADVPRIAFKIVPPIMPRITPEIASQLVPEIAPLQVVSASPAAVPLPEPRPGEGGQTIAGKGEVTGKGRRPMSLAARLGLGRKARAKAEKCLANAIYGEARGEPVRGQVAVAQVVMNRVFSEHYPDNVCDVVYQNAHRHNACQFTFACDDVPDVVTEPEAWERARRIARDTLDGKLWLDDIGKATHYHAYWVRPWWIGTMRKLHKIGVHTFYRPRRWGDGSDEPVWGNAKVTAALMKTL